jgi:GNAT superfamily N-acetyltransferase
MKEAIMTIKICQAEKLKDAAQVRELFWEYLEWANARVNEMYGANFETKTILESDMVSLDKFMPPQGRLLLCYGDDALAGVACLRDNGKGVSEIKRMYVRPAYRHQGVGSALLHNLIEEAKAIGYQCIRLDSARFMEDAHRLYHSSGFQDISSYEGSEIPKEFHANWVFMEKVLS